MTRTSLILNWAIYLTVLCGLCAFSVNYTGWFSSYLFRTALLLPLFSLLLSLPPLFCIRLNVAAPPCVHRGEDAFLVVTVVARHRLHCPYYLPISYRVFQYDPARSTPGKHRRDKRIVHCLFAPYPTKEYGVGQIGGEDFIPIDTAHTAVMQTDVFNVCQRDFLGLFLFPVALPPEHTVPAENSRKRILRISVVVEPCAKRPQKPLSVWSTGVSPLVPTAHPTEQYEMRPYRPGDTLRSVHWKLSAKTDDLLVRESVEPARRTAAITVECPTDPDKADALYDVLDWLLASFARDPHFASVTCAWVNRAGRCITETVSRENARNAREHLYSHMFRDLPPEPFPPYAFATVYRSCDCGYHLDGETV